MITWLKEKEIEIYFSRIPNIVVLYPIPTNSPKENNLIKKKPFLNKEELDIILVDKILNKNYELTAKENYRWDGATIPRMFWRLIGSKTDNRYLIPSLVHDLMCENKELINYDRYFSTCVFDALLKISNVPSFTRFLMFHSVDNYQKFCNWNRK